MVGFSNFCVVLVAGLIVVVILVGLCVSDCVSSSSDDVLFVSIQHFKLFGHWAASSTEWQSNVASEWTQLPGQSLDSTDVVMLSRKAVRNNMRTINI